MLSSAPTAHGAPGEGRTHIRCIKSALLGHSATGARLVFALRVFASYFLPGRRPGDRTQLPAPYKSASTSLPTDGVSCTPRPDRSARAHFLEQQLGKIPPFTKWVLLRRLVKDSPHPPQTRVTIAGGFRPLRTFSARGSGCILSGSSLVLSLST